MKKLLIILLLYINTTVNAQAVSNFSFNVNGTPPAGLTTALTFAAQRWNNYLIINVPVKVNLFFVNSSLFPFSAISLANGRTNFAGATYTNYIYPTSLANQLAGVELNPGEYDMDIYVNLATNYYFGTGKPSTSQDDFISTIMHEIGHGLGFYSAGYVSSGNIGSFGNVPESALAPLTTSFPWRGQDGYPSIYDKYIIKQSLNPLVGLAPNNSITLGDSIKYRTNYFNGPVYANAANSGNPIKLSGGTGAFTLGVDLLHINSSICNTIMSYCTGLGDTVRKPANREMGILKEIGWNTTPLAIKELNAENLISVFPNPTSDFLEIKGLKLLEVKVYDLLGNLVKTSINTAKNDMFKINCSDLTKGLYLLNIQTTEGKVSLKKVVVN